MNPQTEQLLVSLEATIRMSERLCDLYSKDIEKWLGAGLDVVNPVQISAHDMDLANR